MPEVQITIDTDKGTFESEIRGVRGPACEKTARAIREVVGRPAVDRKTAEYHVKAGVENLAQVGRNGKE